MRSSCGIGGMVAPRLYDRRVVRRAGAILGMLALLVQCLVVAVHHPAQAAALSPFDDPHAWCVAGAGETGPSLPDQGVPNAPVHQGGLVCPICVSLQAAGPGLLPVLVALVLPLSGAQPVSAAVTDMAAPEPFGQFAAHPRGPPAPL
ncbi:MAG: DUF2946 family protein [Alphaproteobacteria bacterium]|nr:DUF2946 family protein [Alphaproteobacteria bacterium]